LYYFAVFGDKAFCVAIFKEADAGLPVVDVIRYYGVSSVRYYKWKTK
jgi:hypothetical protein